MYEGVYVCMYIGTWLWRYGVQPNCHTAKRFVWKNLAAVCCQHAKFQRLMQIASLTGSPLPSTARGGSGARGDECRSADCRVGRV